VVAEAARRKLRLTVAVLTPARREQLHRRGLRLEWFTVTWNVVEAFVAIGVDPGIDVISRLS
jgi:hypothetical protein